ncbi:MAG: glycosyltransferase [Deinococcus sp.]|nr:glycosyltransferase [Deinococcus sp.]
MSVARFALSLSSASALHPATVVALPARNEEPDIRAALRALAGQRDGLGRPLAVQAVLLVNNTTDQTAALARHEAEQWPQLQLAVRDERWSAAQGGVVEARRRALNWAAQVAGEGGVIVSTDADTQPAPDWLWQLTAPLRSGQAQASAGRILLDPAERAALPPAARRTHLLDSV